MKIETVKIENVIPYVRNPRKNAEAVAKVAASIKECGFRQPIVLDNEMVVVAGHTRLLAARQLGLEQVPIHIADGLTPAQVKAYRIADNRVAQEAEWDDELLGIEITELETDDFNLALTGFDIEELEMLNGRIDFEPGTESEQGQLDTLDPIIVECPHCGEKFDTRAND